METRAGIAVALLLLGCAQPQISEGNSEPILAVSPTVAPRPSCQQQNTPRRLKLRLTLDRPEDLRVKVNDSVVKGQVVSQRSIIGARLKQESAALQQQLNQLQNGPQFSNYVVEQAEVEQARLRVKQAKRAIATFHADSPWTSYARRVLTLSDNERLRTLEVEYREAQGGLAIAVAKLQEAKQQRPWGPDLLAQRAALVGKIREVETQMDSLGVVRSSYSGVVKAIKWLGQVNHEIQVELTLNLESRANDTPQNRPVS